MSFQELYEQWQQNPYGFSTVTDLFPVAAAAVLGLLVLSATIAQGPLHTAAWRYLGLATATLLTLASLALGFSTIAQEPDAQRELRTSLRDEVASQGHDLPEHINEASLWHQLHQAGEAEVDTPEGPVNLEVKSDGSIEVTEGEGEDEDLSDPGER